MTINQNLQFEHIRLAKRRILIVVVLLNLLIIIGSAYGLHNYVHHNFTMQIRNHVETMSSLIESLPMPHGPASQQGTWSREPPDRTQGRTDASLQRKPRPDPLQRIEVLKRYLDTDDARNLQNIIRSPNYNYSESNDIGWGYFFLFDYEGINLAHGKNRNLEFTSLKTPEYSGAIESLEEAARGGGGCVVFNWPDSKSGEKKRKIACVRPINTRILDERIGGAYIGTGMFLYEIDRHFYALFYRFLLFMTGGFLILLAAFLFLYQRPVDELIQQIIDAVSTGILVTRKQGLEERIVLANQTARELYGTGGKPMELRNQPLDRIIPKRLEANRQTDYATGNHRLDYEAAFPHGTTRMIRDIVRALDPEAETGELVHSVSELKLTSASDFPSRKYMPPLLSKTGVELSFLGSSTLIYCDLSPFLKRCDEREIGVSEAVDELRRHLATITELVLKAGGTVEKFFGERVLIHFGVIRGTDRSAATARNCARLALQIRAALRAQRILHEERIPPIICRIGIATSQVLACSLGTEQRSDFTLVGQAVIMAETLAQEAEQDEILLSQNTSVLLGERFEVGKAKSTSVLWGDKPLYAYPVERERPESSPELPSEPAPHQTKLPTRS